MSDEQREAKIAYDNDAFRRFGAGVMLTQGVQSVQDLNGLMNRVRTYNQFNEDNDPWHEHDFGRIEWNGDKVYWKIDYYNQTLDGGENPLSPKCQRVLTVMLSNEY